jgi:hypothetical protein
MPGKNFLKTWHNRANYLVAPRMQQPGKQRQIGVIRLAWYTSPGLQEPKGFANNVRKPGYHGRFCFSELTTTTQNLKFALRIVAIHAKAQ